MVEVFLEEANEVLTAVEASVTQARASVSNGADDQDALINMRRAFHTLKGSARMVGLTAFGECAWDMEQVMNHWLAQAHTATPELLNLCDDARTLLAEWAHALQGEDAPTIDTNDIAQRARAMRGMAPTVEIAAPSPAPAPVAATPAPTAPAVATLEAAEALDPHAATTLSITGHLEPSYEQTLLDLGDRLSWLNGLVEEIQEQAGTGGGGVTTPSRVTEIANMMGESMSEALALHRALQAQLALQLPGKN